MTDGRMTDEGVTGVGFGTVPRAGTPAPAPGAVPGRGSCRSTRTNPVREYRHIAYRHNEHRHNEDRHIAYRHIAYRRILSTETCGTATCGTATFGTATFGTEMRVGDEATTRRRADARAPPKFPRMLRGGFPGRRPTTVLRC